MCVEAYRQEAEAHRRHINSAFMTFVVLDPNDQPQMLPWIQPQPGVSGCSTLPSPQLPSPLSAQGGGACQLLIGPRAKSPTLPVCWVPWCGPWKCPFCQVETLFCLKEFRPCMRAWLIVGVKSVGRALALGRCVLEPALLHSSGCLCELWVPTRKAVRLQPSPHGAVGSMGY